MKITVYDGYGTIGGNKIHIEEKGEGMFLDFGMNFSRYGKYYEEFLTERPSRGIHDLWELNLIPRLNIYREDLIPVDLINEISAAERIPVNMVLISHAHLDHAGNVSLLRNDIPILGSPETLIILKSIRDTSTGGHLGTELPYTKERKKDETGYVLSVPTKGQYLSRKMFITEKIGDSSFSFLNSIPGREDISFDVTYHYSNHGLHFDIKPFLVDHSILGATAFIISGDINVAYTGDLRFHGMRSEYTDKFFSEAKNASVLITEGTRIGREGDENVSEKQVYENALSIVENSKNLVIADFSSRNFERLQTFVKIAEKTGRGLVITVKDAYYLDALGTMGESNLIKNIKIFDEFGSKSYRWEEQIQNKYASNFISPVELKKNLSEYIICFSFYDMPKLLDLHPENGDYIYSSSEAFGEEDIFSFVRLMEWLRFFNLNVHGIKMENDVIKFEKGLHASGHASKEDILRAIDISDPDWIVPVHTEYPDWFKENFDHVKLLKNNEQFIL